MSRIFDAIWLASDKNQKIIDDWGVSVFSGSYNYRVMRGGNVLSMHAYGCAIDLDAPRNWFHDQNPHFEKVPQVLRAFEDEGWTWGGSWSGRSKDGMHFQAARVR
ncbi:MAG: M15 family metallopeptidase [Flavobacterium sp.]